MREFLDRHPLIDYIQKMSRGIVNKGFRKDIMNYIRNPDSISIEKKGELNRGRIIYLIRCTDKSKGFFAQQRLLLYHLMFAEDMGFVPVVFYQKDYLYYDETYNNQVNNNGFEYYFHQISDVTVDDALKSFSVVESKDKYIKKYIDKMDYNISEGEIARLSVIHRKYIYLKPEMEMKIQNEIDKLLNHKRTLGVHLRGTDFKQEFNDHPVFAGVQEFVNAIQEIYINGRYEQVFIATDDFEIITLVKKSLGAKLNILHYNDVFRSESDLPVTLLESKRKNHRFLLGYEALRDMYTLAQAQGFIGGLSQMSLYVQIVKSGKQENFDNVKILNKGIVRNFKSAYRAGKRHWNY